MAEQRDERARDRDDAASKRDLKAAVRDGLADDSEPKATSPLAPTARPQPVIAGPPPLIVTQPLTLAMLSAAAASRWTPADRRTTTFLGGLVARAQPLATGLAMSVWISVAVSARL